MSNLKDIRVAAGLSQSQLAALSGVSVRMVQYYEQGYKDINKASIDAAFRLATALNCSVEDLIEKNRLDPHL